MGKSKISLRQCIHCSLTTKMVMVGEMAGVTDKIWYRCPRCHHLSLLSPIIENGSDSTDNGDKIEKIYNPEITYTIGERIFHNALNDFGKVIKKETTSDGSHAIIVKFENAGERRLIEDYKIESVLENEHSETNIQHREEVN